MANIHHVRELLASGRFREALDALDDTSIRIADTPAVCVLRAELLERIGRSSEARTLAAKALCIPSLSNELRATCHYVLGRLDGEAGEFPKALGHLQRSVAAATAADDQVRVCWAQLRLFSLLSDYSGPEATSPLLSELRRNVARLADPRLLAALHVHVAQAEAKRSQLISAQHHIHLALRTLRDHPNLWIEGLAHNLNVAIAIMQSDLQTGLEEAREAARLAEIGGGAHSLAVALANLATLLCLTGAFEESLDQNQRVLACFSPESDNYIAVLESIARIHLLRGELDATDSLLTRIELSTGSRDARAAYARRHSLLTRGRLLIKQGRLSEALSVGETTLELARSRGDRLLQDQALLLNALALQKAGRLVEAGEVVGLLSSRLALQPPDLLAQYELVLGSTLSRLGAVQGESHCRRSYRIYSILGHRTGLIEFADSACTEATASDVQPDFRGQAIAAKLAQNVAALVLLANRSELAAQEIKELLLSTGCVESVTTWPIQSLGGTEVLAKDGPAVPQYQEERRLVFDAANGISLHVSVQPKTDLESIATLHAIELIVDAISELQRYRADYAARHTLWPAEDLPAHDTGAVIFGHMLEQMNLARRVAKTTINVLITGESGTGKEIVARAIHDLSDRASKPFVPFNCTAVPRDLLESHLFGHRRGAFTGADRDQIGLIRSAKDGTLFLDEIGEMSLDLQPKLLRFLESGEVAPLGEQGPIKVNVRIVAATNANLDEAVRNGRFREDLYYRLNVVPLTLKPLRERRDEIPGFVNHFVARAANEFNKGRLDVADETMERLLLYRWPGNVRQLQNEIRRMVALVEPDSTLGPDMISEDILSALPIVRDAPKRKEIAVPLTDKLQPTIARIESEMIKAAFREHHGRVDAVAKSLGISRKGLYLKRQRLGL